MEQVANLTADLTSKRRDDYLASRRYGDPTLSLPEALRAYVHGVGFQFDHIVGETQRQINLQAQKRGVIDQNGTMFDVFGRILPEYISEFIPEKTGIYLTPANSDNISSLTLLKESPNDFFDPDFPFQMVLRRQTRPDFKIYRTNRVDIFAHAYGYQTRRLHDGQFIASASSRPFSRIVDSEPSSELDCDLVIIQDRFPGENFAHILFDSITRIGLFVASGLSSKRVKFLMGGTRRPFVEIMISALCATYGLSSDQFYFPGAAQNLRPTGYTFWFSDQIEQYTFPAQMAHPASVEVIRKVSDNIPLVEFGRRRIYVSRSDAGRRRLANEQQLWRLLNRYDFEFVRLSDYSVEAQISLIRGADHIVGPHGMGLALVPLSHRRPSVTELHHPTRGGDCYACVTRAIGFPYRHLVGGVVSSDFDDFEVDPLRLLSESVAWSLGWWRGASYRAPHNLIPSSSNFLGTWFGQKRLPSEHDRGVPPAFAGNDVVVHIRGETVDTNVGTCASIAVESSCTYTASCWVWIGADFSGEAVTLSIGEWPGQRQRPADLADRSTWQRLTATAACPTHLKVCNVVLRVAARPSAEIYSTCWQIESGPYVGEYVPTRLESV